jgi:TonB family protein
MKCLFTILLLILVTISAIAQNVLDTVYFDAKWKKTSKTNYSYYRVIEKLPDGKFKYSDFWKSGKIQMTGILLELNPEIWDGDFVWYYENGSIKEMSTYKNNKIIKPTKQFDSKGNLDVEFVTNLESLDNSEDIKAAINDFISFVNRKIKYPEESRQANIEGQVITSFFIDKSGLPKKITVTKSVSPELDIEAVRIVKLYKWPIPMINGEKTMFWVALPVTFTLR